jgi:hypothetical protein
MSAFVIYMGILVCHMPVDMDQCHSTPGRAAIGGGALIAMLGVAAMLVLMHDARR